MENKVSQSLSANEKKGTPDNPLVSIITPVLNGIKYLEACIESVLNQSYPYIEHIFVDGGSTDGTVEMLAKYKTKYPDRIRFISEPDKGPCDAWNKGLGMAKGEILGWLGSDDMSEPDAIMTVVEFFRTNPDAYFVFGDCNYINENGKIIGKFPTRDFNLEEMINDTNCIPGPSAFYKREVIEKIGLFDINELDYWIRVGKVFQIHRIKKVLSNFRIHKGSGSCSNAYMHTRNDFIICRRHGGSIFSPRSIRYLIYRSVILVWLVPILSPIYHFIKRSGKK